MKRPMRESQTEIAGLVPTPRLLHSPEKLLHVVLGRNSHNRHRCGAVLIHYVKVRSAYLEHGHECVKGRTFVPSLRHEAEHCASILPLEPM